MTDERPADTDSAGRRAVLRLRARSLPESFPVGLGRSRILL
jgi:hypothetical protein